MSTQGQIQPPLDYSNNGPGFLISGYILGFLATVVVILRFWARRLIYSELRLDDYLVLAALIVHGGVLAASTVSVLRGGMGQDIRIVAQTPDAVTTAFETLFAAEICYGLSSSLVKLSVLAFYRRVFPTRLVQIACTILASICIGWAVSIEIVNVVQCRPLEAFWHQELREHPGTHCLDPILFFLGNSIANCVIDFSTIVLPISEVLKLNMSMSRKVGICGVFLLGGIAFAASITRTIFSAVMYNEGTTNFTKQFVPSGIASVVEIYVSIMGACLPTLIPVYRKLRYGNPNSVPPRSSPVDGITTIGRISNRKKLTSGAEGPYERVDTDEEFTPASARAARQVNVSCHSRQSLVPAGSSDIPLKGIVIRQDMTWSENTKSTV